ncbi:hypothetical protein B0H14DRAFT_2593019 [Mycena olivaceomarginata]|nr:hypothetical protein B0H14DRAFT_2593019 [Mycena olivaceomarginata]
MYACILYVILFFPSFLLPQPWWKIPMGLFWHRNKTQETAGMQAICMGHEKEEILMQAGWQTRGGCTKKSANGLVGTLGQGLTLNQGLGDPDPSTQGHMGGHWLYVLSVKLSIQVGPGLEIYAGLMFTTQMQSRRVSCIGTKCKRRTVEAKQRRWLRREKRGYEYWLGTLSSPPAKSPSAVHCQSSGDYIIVVEMPVLLTAALG